MNIQDIKQDFIVFMENRKEFFKPVQNGWYRTRCPYCGDTQKNLREGHFYIKIDPFNDYIMGCNCFKCGHHGVITEETIELLGGDQEIRQKINILNKNSKKIDKKQVVQEERILYFDYKLPKPKRGKKIDYIEKRLDLDFSEMELSKFKVITSLYDFISENNIKSYPFNVQQLKSLEDHYIGFLSNGNSHILFRDITEKENMSWVKYPISEKSLSNKVFYSVTANIDIFTQEEITINLSEGVMDAIGIVKHFNMDKDNIMNIALTGKSYDVMLSRLIHLGLIGSNITINIYSDNDAMFGNKKNAYTTSMEKYKKTLSKYKALYKKINVYYNMKSIDYGVPRNNIALTKKNL